MVSADPAVRSDWARYFEELGLRTLRCVGPHVLCVLGSGYCPLHEEADLAIYDRGAVTPDLVPRLVRASRSFPIAFATDRLDIRGHHEPVITALASESADSRIGSTTHGLVR